MDTSVAVDIHNPAESSLSVTSLGDRPMRNLAFVAVFVRGCSYNYSHN